MGATYHVGVGDLGQKVHQGVARERAHILVLLEPTDGGSHASSCDHRRRVHGELEVCEDERRKVRTPTDASSPKSFLHETPFICP